MTKSASHTSDATPIGSSQASGSVRVRATCRVAVGRSTGAHERDWVALLVIPAGITSALDKSRLTNARGRETGMTAPRNRTVRDVAEEIRLRVAIPPETAPNATLLLRLMAGSVFLWEGILKFVFVNQGVGRFTKLGMPLPAVTAHFVGGLEIVGGALLLLGLATRLIAIPFMIEMVVAMLSTKISLFLGTSPLPLPPAPPTVGMWAVLHEVRSEWAQLLVCAFLLRAGAGPISLDALLAKGHLRRRSLRPIPAAA